MERRGFYLFNVRDAQDDENVLAAMKETGLFEDLQVVEWDRVNETLYVTYNHIKPLPIWIREELAQRGVMC